MCVDSVCVCVPGDRVCAQRADDRSHERGVFFLLRERRLFLEISKRWSLSKNETQQFAKVKIPETL